MIEITVKIKDDSNSFSKKEMLYDPISLSHDDPTLQELVKQVREEIKTQLDDPEITIKTMMVW